MPFFSVIIPTYNRLSLLQQTLDSVLAQRFDDFEVVVVDDGSDDGTQKWLTSQSSRLQVFMQSNRGPGAARNLGAQNAQGEYLAFLDSDDLWFPWTLEVYAQVIKQTKEPAFIAGKPKRFSELRELEPVNEEPLVVEIFPDYCASGDEWRWWGVSSFVIRADAFRASDGFCEKNMNCEDADLALKLGESTGFAQVISPVTFGYRDHGANVTADLTKSLAGAWHQLRTELSGGYPGGARRARERRRILTRHIRPMALECLRRGERREAWTLYRAMLGWHLRSRRWKYIFGFPIVALLALIGLWKSPPR